MATKAKVHKSREYSAEGNVEVCAHRVSYWFKGQRKITPAIKQRLEEEAESRAKTCINDGYIQGELNYEDDTHSYRGWWKIVMPMP